MPIDPSIALSGIKRSNPLQMAGDMAQMQYNMLQAQGMQQQIGANQATSRAFQSAIGPDGKVDYNKAMANMAGDRYAAHKLPEVAGQVSQMQTQELDRQQKQFDLANKKVDWTLNALGASATPQDAIRNMSRGIQQGIISLEEAAPDIQEIQEMMKVGDPQAYQAWLQNATSLTLDTKDRLAQYQFQNLGDRVGMVQTNPGANVPVGMVGSMSMGLSPDQQFDQVKRIDPQTGAEVSDFKGDLVRQQQIQQLQSQLQQLKGGSPDQQPMGKQSASFQTSLAPGQAKAAEAAVERYNKALASLPELNNTMQGLEEAMRVLPETISGPGASSALLISGLANTFGLPIKKDVTENYQELRKYLTNSTNLAASSAGGADYTGSSEKLAAFGAGQPNPETMSPKTLMQAMRYIQAQNKGIKARINATSKFLQSDDGSYLALPKFEADWGKAYNPNVMYLKSLETPEAKSEFLNRISPAQRKAMINDTPKMAELGAFQ